MRRESRRIEDIVPPGAPQGAGVFCRLSGGRYLFCLYDASRIEPGQGYVLGRIGGRRNEGETWEQCVQREVLEETGSRAVVESSPSCCYADLEGRIEPIAVEAEPRPALISRQPAAGAVIPGGIYYNLLFWARLLDEPRPGAELDALVILDEELLRSLAGSEVTLRELRDKGAEVIAARDLDPDARVSLGRSPQILLALLDRGQSS